jgi:hypothetical protein
MIDSELFTFLSSNLSVGDRISPMGKRPQNGELPWLTYLELTPETHYAHSGVSDHVVSLQLDCWADDADDATELARELMQLLDGYRGIWGTIRVGSVFLTGGFDDPEPDAGLYRRMRQVDVHYSELAGS